MLQVVRPTIMQEDCLVSYNFTDLLIFILSKIIKSSHLFGKLSERNDINFPLAREIMIIRSAKDYLLCLFELN